MRIGLLRHRVTIEAFTAIQDEYGEPIETWADLPTNPHMWAEIQSKAAGERFVSGGEQVQAAVSHTVTIRYRTDLTVHMRLLDRGRYLMIENVVDVSGQGRELVLMCSEVQL